MIARGVEGRGRGRPTRGAAAVATAAVVPAVTASAGLAAAVAARVAARLATEQVPQSLTTTIEDTMDKRKPAESDKANDLNVQELEERIAPSGLPPKLQA